MIVDDDPQIRRVLRTTLVAQGYEIWDARNGEELWRKELIPHPGEPGDETWAGTPFESRWHTGVWGHITYDPDLDLVYYGSSGVAPASEAQRKAPGATLAGTDTRFAIHPKTGEIVWRHQTLPRDNWDQECTFEMMVINTTVNPDANASGMMSINPDARRGPRKTLTGIPCKTGIAWSFDAATGEFLWAKQTTTQNLVAAIGPKGQVSVNEDMVMKEAGKTYSICPTYAGGRDWPMGAYDPARTAPPVMGSVTRRTLEQAVVPLCVVRPGTGCRVLDAGE